MHAPLDLDSHYLWPDGSISVRSEKLTELIFKGVPLEKLFVTEITPDVEQYNAFSERKFGLKGEIAPVFPPDWVLPEKYKYADLDEFIVGLAAKIERDDLYDQRLERLATEYELFRTHGFLPVLRVLMYVVDSLTEKKVVWGVGRGSSCSSYLLFLMGLHCVDAVKYSVAITDFIRPEEHEDAT